jgi:GNAT superfamily N-acetyltransferase
MEPALSVRRVGIESFEMALDLLGRFFNEEGFAMPSAQLRSSLRVMLTAQDSAVFLAWGAGDATGVATVTTSIGLEHGRSAELEDLYVLPEARGGGVASALIEAVCEWCRERGCTAVLVTVTPEGEATHQLLDYYQRRGFINTGRLILERALESAE